MSTALRVTFPWGLYHATPWNRSTNEGVVEWPPSSWRILRALYAAWKVHSLDLEEADVEPLLGKLVDEPSFALPPFFLGHTRHYMPGIDHLAGVKSETDKTLDAFVSMKRGASIDVVWPVDLDDTERSVLAELAGGVRYLGRAESVVDVRLLAPGDESDLNCAPADATQGDTQQVLVPAPPLDISALVMSPLQVRSQRRLQPPSTRWADYPTPRVQRSTAHRRRTVRRPVNAVRLAIAGSVLPSAYDAVWIADLLHRAVIYRHGDPTSTLSGKDDAGTPLGGRHEHVHYALIASADRPRRLDTVVAWAPAGFSETEEEALCSLAVLRSPDFVDGVRSRHVTALVAGSVEKVAPELVGPSRVWTSLTPYAPVAHHKGTALEQLAKDITRELRHRDLPLATSVAVVDGDWARFKRYRPGRERLRDGRRAHGVRLEFAEPLSGPLMLGQLSHFGLGLFVPDRGD